MATTTVRSAGKSAVAGEQFGQDLAGRRRRRGARSARRAAPSAPSRSAPWPAAVACAARPTPPPHPRRAPWTARRAVRRASRRGRLAAARAAVRRRWRRRGRPAGCRAPWWRTGARPRRKRQLPCPVRLGHRHQQRGLAAAAGPDDREPVAGLQLERRAPAGAAGSRSSGAVRSSSRRAAMRARVSATAAAGSAAVASKADSGNSIRIASGGRGDASPASRYRGDDRAEHAGPDGQRSARPRPGPQARRRGRWRVPSRVACARLRR